MQSGDDLEDERGKLKRVEVGIEDEKSMQGLIWRRVRGRLRIHRLNKSVGSLALTLLLHSLPLADIGRYGT